MAGVVVVNTDPYLSSVRQSQVQRHFNQEITKLTYHQYGGYGLVTLLQADNLSVIPRKLLFFNIKSVNEVHIANARIESHFYENDRGDTAIVPAVIDHLADRRNSKRNSNNYLEFGLITRVIVKDIFMQLFKADTLMLVLSAAEGRVDHKSKMPFFINAVLQDPTATNRIVSNKMIWDPQGRVFKIPGKYIAITDKGRSNGKGIKVDLAFTILPI
jgi:hypothetical protein